MRLTVFGATGGTGTEVVLQALGTGHQVTAVVRDPARLTVSAGNLTVVTADVTDPEAIITALEGADAAVSALGRRRIGSATISATILTQGVHAILAAMDKTGVRRLVAVSTSRLFPEPGEPPLARYVAKPLLQALLWSAKADAHRMENLIVESPADWTIMRPSRLLDKPRRQYRTALDRAVPNRYGSPPVGRADLADAILKTLDDPAAIGHRVNIGY
ncbi:MAG: NAD(P)H-binding protein [Nocardiopsaceae bacterium]|nr:NAD(P)H-binding protein [Nocardiopsaceae bacterium]